MDTAPNPLNPRVLEVFLRKTSEGFMIIGADGFISYMSPSVRNMVGFRPDESGRVPLFPAAHPDDTPRLKGIFENLLREGGETSSIVSLRARDGNGAWRDFEGTAANLVDDPDVNGIVIQFRDVTERRKIEAALQDALRKYKLLADNVLDVIWTTDPQFRFTYISPSVTRLRGITPEEAMRESLADKITPEKVDKVFRDEKAMLEAVARGDRDVHAYIDMKLTRKDGSAVPVGMSINPLFDEAGNHTGYIGVTRDVSAQKAAEESLRASLAEKELLLKEIHHRVKNNMQIIHSLLNLQAAQVGDPVFLNMLRDSQRRIRSMSLVHEKLYRSPDLGRIDFPDYMRSLIAGLGKSLAVPSRIRIVTEVGDVSLDIHTAIPCGLLVSELVSNAFKHAFPGDRTGQVVVRLGRRPDGKLNLSVADDGVGLPADFEIRRTESLGMQLVGLLVEQLNGTLEVRRGRGTEFRVVLEELRYKPR